MTIINCNALFDDRNFRRGIARMKAKGADPSGALNAVGAYMQGETIKNFDEGGRPDKWKPLSKVTLLQRAGGKKGWRNAFKKSALKSGSLSFSGMKKGAQKKFIMAKTLIRSGRLRGSVRHSVSGWSVVWGSNVKYAAIHQFGGKAGRGKKVTIPARPYLVFLPENLNEIKTIMLKWIAGGIK